MRCAILFLALAACAHAGPGAFDEPRYCGEPKRNARGEIVRRADVLRAFRAIHPCPATGAARGPCPGWSIDHVIPLACGGCDKVLNLQWMKNEIKSCAGASCKDRWERPAYCRAAL